MLKLTDEILQIVSRFRKAFLASYSPAGATKAAEYSAEDLAVVKNLAQMFLQSGTYESHLEQAFL